MPDIGPQKREVKQFYPKALSSQGFLRSAIILSLKKVSVYIGVNNGQESQLE